VIVYDPVAALEPTATVIVDEPPAVTDAGLKLTVTPEGSPDAFNATGCAAPLVTAVLIVEVPFAPCATDRLLGFALIEKFDAAGAVTVNATEVECVALALVPVTVIVYDPCAALGSTATVIVDEPPAVTDAGLKLTVTPAGWPDALNATDCAAPLVTAVLIVDVPLPPCPTDRLFGFALIEKSDGCALQPGNLNDAIRVCQLNVPFEARYSFVYQKVQSSEGSMTRLL